MDENEDDEAAPWWPLINDDKLMIKTTNKFDDSTTKLINLAIKLANYIVKVD